MEYDEDRVLTQYVWDYYGRLMTEFEGTVGRVILWRAKLAAVESPEKFERINRLSRVADDAAVAAALADGAEAFRRRVRDRLLAEHGPDVFVNRCPQCKRVVRTPQARQCFWCGFDWHS